MQEGKKRGIPAGLLSLKIACMLHEFMGQDEEHRFYLPIFENRLFNTDNKVRHFYQTNFKIKMGTSLASSR